MKKIIYSIAILAMTIMASCKRDYLDVNQNPNSAVTSTAELVLPNALNVTAAGITRNEVGAFWAGQWAPPTSVSGFGDERTYNTQASWGTATTIWSTYDNITDYEFIEKDALAKGRKRLAGIAQVMKAFNYQLLVDAYGDIPYTDAVKGDIGITTPKYDKAQDIYLDLIVKLDAAVANLSSPTTLDNPNVTPQEDIYCGGNMIKWVKFANTLKLRILLRKSELPAEQGYITAQIAKIANPLGGGLFLGAYEDVFCNPGYLQTAGKQNPFWNRYGFTEANTVAANAEFYALSEYAINAIEKPTGPRDFQRILRIAKPAPATAYTFKGIPYGVTGNTAFFYALVSGFGPGLLQSFKQNMLIMTASEALMLQAEANVKGYAVGAGGAYKSYFKDAVRSSFVLLKAGANPLSGAAAPGQLPGWYTDKLAISETVNFTALKDNFDATKDASIKAADNYLSYGITNTSVGSASNRNTIADIDSPVATDVALKVIMEQKWVCLIGFAGFEAWCDVRKYQNVSGGPSPILNTPKSVSSAVIGTPAQRPLRIPYPSLEAQTNNANLTEAITRQGLGSVSNILSTRIFWDKD